MRSPRRSVRALVVLVVALLATVVGVGSSAQAQAASTGKQRVYGAVICPKLTRCPSVKLTWFDANWAYLGSAKANGGGYSLKLAPGTYHLQFVDQRPAYDVSKFAPTDVTVRIGNRPVAKNVTLKHGGAITGTARAGHKPLASATIYAANKSGQSFPTTANTKGQFAVGGLPAGKYCLFTYDKQKRYVGKCTWAGGVDFGQFKNKNIALSKRAGSLTVFVDTATGGSAPASNLTVTSKTTGQWWTAKVSHGKAVFTGVFPGRFNYKYDGGGIWLGASGSVQNGNVRPNAMGFGNVRLTKRGGWIAGSLIDAGPDGTTSGYALAPPFKGATGAVVNLYNVYGQLLASTHSDKSGFFKLQGPLTTQSGLTIKVEPTPQAGGYMIGEGYCAFKKAKFTNDLDTGAPISITTGQETFLGDLPVKRAPDQTNPKCATNP